MMRLDQMEEGFNPKRVVCSLTQSRGKELGGSSWVTIGIALRLFYWTRILHHRLFMRRAEKPSKML